MPYGTEQLKRKDALVALYTYDAQPNTHPICIRCLVNAMSDDGSDYRNLQTFCAMGSKQNYLKITLMFTKVGKICGSQQNGI